MTDDKPTDFNGIKLWDKIFEMSWDTYDKDPNKYLNNIIMQIKYRLMNRIKECTNAISLDNRVTINLEECIYMYNIDGVVRPKEDIIGEITGLRRLLESLE